MTEEELYALKMKIDKLKAQYKEAFEVFDYVRDFVELVDFPYVESFTVNITVCDRPNGESRIYMVDKRGTDEQFAQDLRSAILSFVDRAQRQFKNMTIEDV